MCSSKTPSIRTATYLYLDHKRNEEIMWQLKFSEITIRRTIQNNRQPAIPRQAPPQKRQHYKTNSRRSLILRSMSYNPNLYYHLRNSYQGSFFPQKPHTWRMHNLNTYLHIIFIADGRGNYKDSSPHLKYKGLIKAN
jgi:hypothetical protein